MRNGFFQRGNELDVFPDRRRGSYHGFDHNNEMRKSEPEGQSRISQQDNNTVTVLDPRREKGINFTTATLKKDSTRIPAAFCCKNRMVRLYILKPLGNQMNWILNSAWESSYRILRVSNPCQNNMQIASCVYILSSSRFFVTSVKNVIVGS